MRRATRSERRLLNIALHRWRGYRLPDGEPRRTHRSPAELLRAGRFEPDQLAIGVGVEREHTNVPEIALEIATAHLLERPDYYGLLEKMEKSPRARVAKAERRTRAR